ncbi:MAG: hypothetical protein ABSE63_07620 [Thermoguttaceae bacterium]|jgi:TRAP-type C4-dicarboxylate transport system permease small subunit
MNSAFWVSILLYRLVIVIIGFGFAYLGFRLLSVKSGQQRDEVKEVPQTFVASLKTLDTGYWFVLFGTVIVAICLLQELFINFDKYLIKENNSSANTVSIISQDTTTSSILGIGMLLATMVLAFLTAWYAWSIHRYVLLNKKQLQLQIDPYVVAFTRPSSNTHQVEIVVRNIGNGFAKDIRFERPENVEEATWHNFLNAQSTSTPLGTTVISHGIPVLPPHEEISTPWEPKGFGLMPDHGLYIICKCKRLGSGPKSEVEPITCFLDALTDLKKE